MVEFKINHDEKEAGDSNTDHYKVNPREFFISTQVSIYFFILYVLSLSSYLPFAYDIKIFSYRKTGY